MAFVRLQNGSYYDQETGEWLAAGNPPPGYVAPPEPGSLEYVRNELSKIGIYNHFGPTGHEWYVLNGRTYQFRPGFYAPADVIAAYPLATAQMVSDAMNPDAPGNGAGKGSMKEGILSAVGFIAAVAGIGQLAGLPASVAQAAEAAQVAAAPAAASSAVASTAATETFALASPWGSGAPGLLDLASPVTAAAAPVLDVVAPVASTVGASGAALPAAWAYAVTAPAGAAVVPFFQFPTVIPPAGSTAATAATSAAGVAPAASKAAAPGLIDKLLGTAATAATSALVNSSLAKQPDTPTPPPAAQGSGGALLLAAGALLFYKLNMAA